MPNVPSTSLSLQQAVERADWARVFEARREGVPWSKLCTRAGLTALGMALLQDSADIAEQLLGLGAPTGRIPLQDGNELSPLGIAMAQENPELVHLLLEAGADPNEPDPADPLATPPLLAAARRGWAPAIELLLRCGAHPNAVDAGGRTAWGYLVEHLEQTPEEAGSTLQALTGLLAAGGRPSEGSLPRIQNAVRTHRDPQVREAATSLLKEGQRAQAFRESLHLRQHLTEATVAAVHDPRL